MNLPPKKRKHHVVWKHYLKPWTNNANQIACLRNRQDLFTSALENIGNVRDFYKLQPLNSTEIELLRHMFVLNEPEYVQKAQQGWINYFSTIFELEKLLKSQQPSSEIQEAVDVAIHNLGEDLQAKFEYSGAKYLHYIYEENLDFYSDFDGNMEFNLFLMMQLFRTEKIKSGLANIPLSIPNIDMEKFFNVMAVGLATNSAGSLFRDRNLFKLQLLRNKTKYPFITSDHPVVNTLANLDKLEPPNELEIYYPVTPSKAIIIGKSISHDIAIDIENVTIIQRYNKYIKRTHYQQLYSNSEESLIVYKRS